MFFFGGGKCPILGVVNVRILGVINVLLANDSQSFLLYILDRSFNVHMIAKCKQKKGAKCIFEEDQSVKIMFFCVPTSHTL